ncbi:MAG: phosphonate ABC transporter, permease protein PhnE [Rhodospirillales bacterium]
MSVLSEARPSGRRPSEAWELHRAINPRTIGILLIVAILAAFSAKNVELDKAAKETWAAVLALAGHGDSKVVNGAANFLKKSFPLQMSTITETNRIQNFDPNDLPLFSHIETRTEREYSVMESRFTEVTGEYLVQPIGYLVKALVKMWETIEMALWGTVFSIMLAIPLSILGAKNFTPNRAVYSMARAVCSFNRAMPELILALFFVLMYGFGPIAGIFALALHTSGFLGKFFADEIENADPGPQRALQGTGANRIKVLRYAVLPEVLPQYYAYVQYILERNIRTATILGIVGAGGIGTELKGRWDLFDYDHVATILVVIFATVMVLEWGTQRLRAKAM